ncbi:MAG: 2OG-Fe dioxygenase family protein [Pseudomonadota bacterium]|nr:2OG-Fe dioxygenase family protein [Pseudomonadota bacterium]
MVASFAAPQTSLNDVASALRERGYAVLVPADVAALADVDLADLNTLTPSWDNLELDHYLRDGGNYRRRRHSCFIARGATLEQAPHRMHWQSEDYNALHGGMERWFEPIEQAIASSRASTRLLLGLASVFSAVMPVPRWHIEAHQFRIDTSDGLGRPTPEGAHRDGVDFVAVLLVARNAIKGGETRVFQANGPDGQRFTLEQPWSMLLLDDARVIHESTPIQPLDDGGHRDTFVLTFRAAAFQGEGEV